MKKLVLSDDARKAIRDINKRISVQKVVATRSVKGRVGDHYVGFSASWDSVQNDAGGAGDLMDTTSCGVSLRDAKLAAYIVGMQSDIAAHEHAAAGGNLHPNAAAKAIKAIRVNYSQLIANLFIDKSGKSVE